MPEGHFDIKLTPTAIGSSVVYDGKQLDDVRSVTIRGAVGEVTTVTVEFVNVTVNVEADGELIEAT